MPQDPAQVHTYLDKRKLLLGALINSITKEIRALIIPKTGSNTPSAVIQAVKGYFDATSPDDHEYLKPLADNLVLTTDMTTPEYHRHKRALRAPMLTAKYPDIDNPITAVKFMIAGFDETLESEEIGSHMLLNKKMFVNIMKYSAS